MQPTPVKTSQRHHAMISESEQGSTDGVYLTPPQALQNFWTRTRVFMSRSIFWHHVSRIPNSERERYIAAGWRNSTMAACKSISLYTLTVPVYCHRPAVLWYTIVGVVSTGWFIKNLALALYYQLLKVTHQHHLHLTHPSPFRISKAHRCTRKLCLETHCSAEKLGNLIYYYSKLWRSMFSQDPSRRVSKVSTTSSPVSGWSSQQVPSSSAPLREGLLIGSLRLSSGPAFSQACRNLRLIHDGPRNRASPATWFYLPV